MEPQLFLDWDRSDTSGQKNVSGQKRCRPEAVIFGAGQKRSLFLALFQMRSGPEAVASDGGASLTSSDGPSDVTVKYFAQSYSWRRFAELFRRLRQCNFEDRLFAVMSTCCASPGDTEVRHLRGSFQQQERDLVRDARGSCFFAKVTRRVFVELPEEDRGGSGSQQCGMLRKSLCGTRDAAHDWERELGGFLEKLSSSCFHSEETRGIAASVWVMMSLSSPPGKMPSV